MIGGYYSSWTDPRKSVLAPKIVRTVLFKATGTTAGGCEQQLSSLHLMELLLRNRLISRTRAADRVAVATTYSRGH